MKHQTTIKTHAPLEFLNRLLIAAIILAALPAVIAAQEGGIEDPGETVSVNAQVVRIGIVIPPSEGEISLVVRNGAEQSRQVAADRPGPANPLSLVILLDISMPSGKEWLAAGEELANLPRKLGPGPRPRLVVALPEGSARPARIPDGWHTSFTGDVRTAFDLAIREIQGAKSQRRALLILTDRFDELPAGIFEQTDARLLYDPALVFLATVRAQKPVKYGSSGRTISRMNLVGWETVQVHASGDYVGAQFRYFVRAARSLHVVSFPVPDGELAVGPTYILEALSGKEGRVLNRQPRKINSVPSADDPNPFTRPHARK